MRTKDGGVKSTFLLELRFEIIGEPFAIGARFFNNGHVGPIEKLNDANHLARMKKKRKPTGEVE